MGMLSFVDGFVNFIVIKRFKINPPGSAVVNVKDPL